MVSDHTEDGRVNEPGLNIADAHLVFRNGYVNIEITVKASSVEEAVQLANSILNKLHAGGNRYDDIAKIAKIRTIALTEQVTMPEHQVATPVGITRYRHPNCLLLTDGSCGCG